MNVTIVIDVFRASTTACYVLELHPSTYELAVQESAISRLASAHINPLIIGKPEEGMEGHNIYHIPNSPTRVFDVEISNRHILHRTAAGAKGVLLAKDADIVLVAGFVNAGATVRLLKTMENPVVTIVPMGHEGTTPSLEDDICAQYIEALIHAKTIELTPYLPDLKSGPGSYFFKDDQWQYPSEDFERCLEIDRFDFAIQAIVKDDHAVLIRREGIMERTNL